MNEDKTLDAARDELQDAIQALEREVDAPILPGEVETWCGDVTRPLRAVREAFTRVARDQESMLAEILEEDPALSARAEALDEGRRDAGERLSELESRLSRLRAEAEPERETSEEPVQDGEKLRRDIIQWIVDARASDREIEGWFQEAIYRDRGIAD